jgi:hypothetical protein
MPNAKTRRKRSSLSAHHVVSYGPKPQKKTIPLNKTAAQMKKDKEKLTGQISGVSLRP